jgi:hypothetical protein
MDDKRYNNAVECVKVTQRTLLIILTLEAFLAISAKASVSGLQKVSSDTINIPYINLPMERNLGTWLVFGLMSACGFGACAALVKLTETYSELTSDYQKLFNLYPTFLNANVWLRALAALAFGFSIFISYGALLVTIYPQEAQPGFLASMFLFLLGIPFWGIMYFITFWHKG